MRSLHELAFYWLEYFILITGSVIFYCILQYAVAPMFFSRISRIYRTLTRGCKMTWNIRPVASTDSIHFLKYRPLIVLLHRFASITNSVIVALMVSVALFDASVWQHPLKLTCFLINIGMSICCGYFIADILWMWMYPKESEAELVYFVHHGICILGVVISLSYNRFGLLMAIRLLSEYTQPFHHFRCFYRECGFKGKFMYLFLKWCNAICCLTFRVLIIPIYYYKVNQVIFTKEWHQVHPLTHATWLCMGFFFDVLNLVWFIKIILRMTRSVSKEHND